MRPARRAVPPPGASARPTATAMSWLRDLRLSFRALVKSPLFSLAAVLSVALGVGAATAVFSLFDAVVLRPLPFPDASRLVQVSLRTESRRPHGPFSLEEFDAYRGSSRSFQALAAHTYLPVTASAAHRAEVVQAELVSPGYFRVLGTEPARGRLLGGAADAGVLVSRHFQETWFGDRDPVGGTIRLGGQPFTIRGVMPEGFRGVSPLVAIDLWIPLAEQVPLAFASLDEARSAHWLGVIGRLRDGVSLDQARAEGTLAGRWLAGIAGEEGQRLEASVDRYRGLGIPEDRRGSLGGWGAALGALIVLILVLSCSNVANLVLVRATERRSEAAIRLALGASRSRLVRRLLTESVEVAVAGGVLGFVLAYWATALFGAFEPRMPAHLRFALDLTPDLRVFALAFGVSVVAGAAFGVVPALRASRVEVAEAVREGAAQTTVGAGTARLQRALVAVQVAVSFLLLIATGLQLRSLQERVSVDTGLELERVLDLSVDFGGQGSGRQEQALLVDRLAHRLAASAGVEAVGEVSRLPFAGGGARTEVRRRGEEPSGGGGGREATTLALSPGTFRLLGIRLLRGRDFAASDAAAAPPVAVVDRELARRLWPGGDALGQELEVGDGEDRRVVQVVGVVENAMYTSIRSTPAPMLFRPLAQAWDRQLAFVLRASGDPESLAPTVRDAVRAVAPDLAIEDLTPAETYYRNLIHSFRSLAVIFAAVALAGLLLAGCGIFGVVSYVVRRRRREVAIRMVLGAEGVKVARLVVGGVMKAVLLGLAAGLGLGALLAHGLSRFLFGIRPVDPATFAGVSLFLLAVALSAALAPTGRAVRIDPASSLREE